MKNSKILITAVVVLAVIGLGANFIAKAPRQKPAGGLDVKNSEQTIPNQAAVSENLVIYTDSGYSPKSLTIKKGETVVFKNESSRGMWTASAMHPTHNGYPTTGGCLGSTFDECEAIQPGGSWSFKFDFAGSWGYHNHVSASHFGKIIVEE